MTDFRVVEADWVRDRNALTRLRFEVFVSEQRVPPELELDGIDPECRHVQAISADDSLIGCARVLPDHHVGRMCVARAWRGRGVGSAILRFIINEARSQSIDALHLNAQLSALPFYQRFGFEAVGDVFMDAGIEHRKMTLIIDP